MSKSGGPWEFDFEIGRRLHSATWRDRTRDDGAPMIHAELERKLSETERISGAERWEDVLTSSVFGLLRYLPTEVACAYLSGAVNAAGDALDLGEVRDFSYRFWPALPGWTREPDVVIDAAGRPGTLRRRVVVEAKYLSGKSSAGPSAEDPQNWSDQLADELVSAWKDHLAGNPRADKPPALVYVTGHHTFPQTDIDDSSRQIVTRAIAVRSELYWLPWWRLSEVLRGFLAGGPDLPDRAIAEDLLALLEARGQVLLYDAWRTASPRPLSAPWRFLGGATATWWVAPPLSFSNPWSFVGRSS